uniref:uncharacterized protein n=1 Tax=Myxine glutinosa TaxID=7769 RepID=UPI00358EDC46
MCSNNSVMLILIAFAFCGLMGGLAEAINKTRERPTKVELGLFAETQQRDPKEWESPLTRQFINSHDEEKNPTTAIHAKENLERAKPLNSELDTILRSQWKERSVEEEETGEHQAFATVTGRPCGATCHKLFSNIVILLAALTNGGHWPSCSDNGNRDGPPILKKSPLYSSQNLSDRSLIEVSQQTGKVTLFAIPCRTFFMLRSKEQETKRDNPWENLTQPGLDGIFSPEFEKYSLASQRNSSKTLIQPKWPSDTEHNRGASGSTPLIPNDQKEMHGDASDWTESGENKTSFQTRDTEHLKASSLKRQARGMVRWLRARRGTTPVAFLINRLLEQVIKDVMALPPMQDPQIFLAFKHILRIWSGEEQENNATAAKETISGEAASDPLASFLLLKALHTARAWWFQHRVSRLQRRDTAVERPSLECLLRPLSVNLSKDNLFDDILTEPETVNIQDCGGDCVVLGRPDQFLPHTQYVALLSEQEHRPCCVPVTFSPIQVIVLESQNVDSAETRRTSSDAVVLRHYHNLVATTCGCR